MRYQLLSYNNELVFQSDTLEDIAEHLDVTHHYLYVQLSIKKGEYTKGKGKTQIIVRDTGRRTDSARGPKKTEYKYYAFYEETETGMEFKPPHEVTLEEVIKQTGLSPSTVAQRFSMQGEVTTKISRAPQAYRYDRLIFRRGAA